jgi:hypothetical protein
MNHERIWAIKGEPNKFAATVDRHNFCSQQWIPSASQGWSITAPNRSWMEDFYR